MNKPLLYILIFLLIITTVSAQKGHLSLLAVTEEGNQGTKADLYLEIKPGTGKVFIETIPLTKLDTQLSTRFAQKIACDFLKTDCSRKDFFYTIRSDATLIGGPSAGAAVAVLTAAMLDNKEVNQKVTLTGTINAGGLIGSVGSVKEKVMLAKLEGIQTVLIPVGSRYYEDNTTGATVDIQALGNSLSLDVKEISTLAEALTEVTGNKYTTEPQPIIVDETYREVMKSIAIDLCNRTVELKRRTPQKNGEIFTQALNTTYEAMQAFEKQQYYTTASKCFAANLGYDFLILNASDISEDELWNVTLQVRDTIDALERSTDKRPLKILNDLQTFVVVKERLAEASDSIAILTERAKNETKHVTNENINATLSAEQTKKILAYATERLYTAGAWSTFFGTGSKSITLNQNILREACERKLSELQERYQFLQVLTENRYQKKEQDLLASIREKQKGNYHLCLFLASREKAEIDYTLAAITSGDQQLNTIIDQRLEIAQADITQQTQAGFFPILGYSYYEYASALKETNPGLALLFAQYALEMSHIDHYFEAPQETPQWKIIVEETKEQLNAWVVLALILGFVGGIGVMSSLFKYDKK